MNVLNTLPHYFNTEEARKFLDKENLKLIFDELDDMVSDIYNEPTAINRNEKLSQRLGEVIQNTHPSFHNAAMFKKKFLQREKDAHEQNKQWEDYYRNTVTRSDVSRNRDMRDAEDTTTKKRDGEQYYFDDILLRHTKFSECVRDDYKTLVGMNKL